MILAYSNLSAPFFIQLFDDEKNLIDTLDVTIQGDSKFFRFDLLKGIFQLLEKNSHTPKDITGIFLVNGPGRFTPVRIACLIANTFLSEQNVKLCTLTADEFEKAGSDFCRIIKEHTCTETTFAQPIFSSPPRINIKK